MERAPVARRTRLQRTLNKKETMKHNKKAKLENRRKFREQIGLLPQEVRIVCEDDNDDGEGEVTVVDEAEYLRRISHLSLRDHHSPPLPLAPLPIAVEVEIVDDNNNNKYDNNNINNNNIVEVDIVDNNNDNYNNNNYDNNNNDIGVGEGDFMFANANCNPEQSDDSSVQFMGERFDPLTVDDADYIGDDEDNEEEVGVPVAPVVAGEEKTVNPSGVGMASSEKDDEDEDDDEGKFFDKDFALDERGNYSSSVYTSSDDEEDDDESEESEDHREEVKVVVSKKSGDGAAGESSKKGKDRVKKKWVKEVNFDESGQPVVVVEEEVRANGSRKLQGGGGVEKEVGTNASKKLRGGVEDVGEKKQGKKPRYFDEDAVNCRKNPIAATTNRGYISKNIRESSSYEYNCIGDEDNPGTFQVVLSLRCLDGYSKNGRIRRAVNDEETQRGADDSEDGQSDLRPQKVKASRVVGSSSKQPVYTEEDEGIRSSRQEEERGDLNEWGRTLDRKSDEEQQPDSVSNRKRKLKENEVQNSLLETILEGSQEGDEDAEPSTVQDEGMEGLKPKARSNRKRKLRANELQDSLLTNILEASQEGLVYNPPPAPKETFYLPLKFTYPPKKALPEKTEDELELEKLFQDLEFGLQACNIGSDGPSVKEDGSVAGATGEASQRRLCAGGHHHFIHNEEIGIVCKNCSFVKLESKYVTPAFCKDIFGRSNREDQASRLPVDGDNSCEYKIPDTTSGGRGEPEPKELIQGTVWELIPGTWTTLYPHQREGFEFIWRNVAGSINIAELGQPTKFGLGGCIICHAPGTGKTRLSIVFIQSFLKQYPMCKPVIVAPRTMLRTWQEEFARWKVDIPFFNFNEDELTGKEDPEILKSVGGFKHKKTIRMMKLGTWANGQGILGISYGLYEQLAGEGKHADKMIREALLKVPGVMFLDEGHTPRNEKSKIWRVLSDVSTKRKIILSGTPFQNNFEELSNTISLVREEFGIPLLSGNHSQDERRIEELRNKIRPFVHVHKGEILKQTLRGLFASLIVLKPSQLQERCFAALARTGQTNFAVDNQVSVASVHPSIFLEQRPSFMNKKEYKREWQDLLEKHKEDLDAGVKTRFLVELIQLSQGERVLVFGQFIPPLLFIADLLKSRFSWAAGRELLYMDGQQDTKERQSTIRIFNDPRSEARVLLASTKACSEGIHLVGASRVVLLDVVWNPSVERQAISRAYRLGQKKDVFVYHLISGKLEDQKYKRQATKERLSELVFKSSEEGDKESIGEKVGADQVLEAMINNEKMKTMFKKIVYQPKADNLIEAFDHM